MLSLWFASATEETEGTPSARLLKLENNVSKLKENTYNDISVRYQEKIGQCLSVVNTFAFTC